MVNAKALRSVAMVCAALLLVAWPDTGRAARDDVNTITVGIYSVPRQLDPAKQKAGEEWALSYLIFDGLTDVDKDMGLRPQLAQTWQSSDDLTEWTFELRQDVKFHNGDPLTAEDVVATFDRVLNPSGGSPGRAGISMVKAVTAKGPHTIVFSLKFPYGDLPYTLADRWYKIVSHKALNTLSTHPIGTGPFKFQEYIVGERAVMTSNLDFWEKGIPKTKRIVFRVLPEPIVAVTALQNGEIDLLFQTPLEHVPSLKRNPNVTVDFVTTTGFDMIVMDAKQAPFDNEKVRLALKYATDKNELVKAALFGFGSPTITPVTHIPGIKDPALEDISPDYEKAKGILAEAGFPNGLDVTMYVPDGRPTRKALGIVLQQMWKRAGVNLNLRTVSWDKFIADIEFKAALYTDGFRGFPTVDASIYPFLHSAGSWNLGHWGNPQVDELLDKARRVTDEKQRQKLYSEVQALVRDKGAIIFPYVLQNSDAYRKNLQGFHTSQMLRVDIRQAYKTGR